MDFRIFNSNRPNAEKKEIPQEDLHQDKLVLTQPENLLRNLLLSQWQKINMDLSAPNSDQHDR